MLVSMVWIAVLNAGAKHRDDWTAGALKRMPYLLINNSVPL